MHCILSGVYSWNRDFRPVMYFIAVGTIYPPINCTQEDSACNPMPMHSTPLIQIPFYLIAFPPQPRKIERNLCILSKGNRVLEFFPIFLRQK